MNMYLFASLVIIGALVLAWVIVKLFQILAKLPLKVACSKFYKIIITGVAASWISYLAICALAEIFKKAPSDPTFGTAVVTVAAVIIYATLALTVTVGALIAIISFYLDDSWKSDEQYFDIVKKYYLKR